MYSFNNQISESLINDENDDTNLIKKKRTN